jgi:hypothetical protein
MGFQFSVFNFQFSEKALESVFANAAFVPTTTSPRHIVTESQHRPNPKSLPRILTTEN